MALDSMQTAQDDTAPLVRLDAQGDRRHGPCAQPGTCQGRLPTAAVQPTARDPT